jgi:hypothetical protein
MRLPAKRPCGGVARRHLGRPQVCGPRLVAHRLAHLLAFNFRRLRLHVPRWSEIRERRVGAGGSRARSVIMTKCGREKPSPRQYSRGRTPLPHKMPRGKIFAALRIRFSNPCSLRAPATESMGSAGSRNLECRGIGTKIRTCKRQSPSKILTPKVGSPRMRFCNFFSQDSFMFLGTPAWIRTPPSQVRAELRQRASERTAIATKRENDVCVKRSPN